MNKEKSKPYCNCQCHPQERGTTCTLTCEHCSPSSNKGECKHLIIENSGYGLFCKDCRIPIYKATINSEEHHSIGGVDLYNVKQSSPSKEQAEKLGYKVIDEYGSISEDKLFPKEPEWETQFNIRFIQDMGWINKIPLGEELKNFIRNLLSSHSKSIQEKYETKILGLHTALEGQLIMINALKDSSKSILKEKIEEIENLDIDEMMAEEVKVEILTLMEK